MIQTREKYNQSMQDNNAIHLRSRLIQEYIHDSQASISELKEQIAVLEQQDALEKVPHHLHGTMASIVSRLSEGHQHDADRLQQALSLNHKLKLKLFSQNTGFYFSLYPYIHIYIYAIYFLLSCYE